jgi:uncharacterized protein (TIGR02453 family)
MKQHQAMLADDILPPFTGFPPEGLTFLRRLKKNNNRPWFQKHKQEYEELLLLPMRSLIATLAAEMAGVAPEIEFNPRRSIFRIYRDVRFSKNKDPYKTNIAAVFKWRGMKGATEAPGLYLGIELEEIYIGGGVYLPSGDQLKAFRRSMAERPEDFLSVVNNRNFRRRFGGIEGERLQRVPAGFPPDHPMREHLKHKQFYAGVELKPDACLHPRFVRQAVDTYVGVLPLVRWLARAMER